MMRVDLLLLTFGVFVWLLTVFLSAWRKRRQREAAPDVGPHVLPVLPRTRPLPPPLGMALRGTSVPAEGRMAPPGSAQQRMRRRREVRRGMVLITILGPCAALSNHRVLLGEVPGT